MNKIFLIFIVTILLFACEKDELIITDISVPCQKDTISLDFFDYLNSPNNQVFFDYNYCTCDTAFLIVENQLDSIEYIVFQDINGEFEFYFYSDYFMINQSSYLTITMFDTIYDTTFIPYYPDLNLFFNFEDCY